MREKGRDESGGGKIAKERKRGKRRGRNESGVGGIVKGRRGGRRMKVEMERRDGAENKGGGAGRKV